MTSPQSLYSAPPLVGCDVAGLAVAMIRAIGEHVHADSRPKPRVRLTTPVQFLCGWCGEWDVAENLRLNALTGNNWPIHPKCVCEWYDKGQQ